jgi:type IV secretion system protein TrbF
VLAHSESQLHTTVQTNGAGRPALAAPRTDAPYLRGRAEFDSVFGDLAKGKRNWQLIAFASLTVAFILAGGIVALATQSRITPYIVEVDQLGRAQAFGPADQLRSIDQRLIVGQLARFVRDIRTVVGDPTGQADLIERAYDFVDQGASPFLNAYFTAPQNDPRILGKDITRLVEITSVLPLPTTTPGGAQTTWKLSWTETTLDRVGGGAPTEAAWEGYFTTRITPPATLDRITVNPLGLYITSINWTQLAKRTTSVRASEATSAPLPATSGTSR